MYKLKLQKNYNQKTFVKNFKTDFIKRKFLFWSSLNSNLLKISYGTELLMGGACANTNTKWRSNFLISKNNVEIFNKKIVKVRIISLYAAFKWLNSARMDVFSFKFIKFMFASRTPVFSHLMEWAGLMTFGTSSSNRWLNGRITAQTNLKFLPNYLFIPDPDINQMITKEAKLKRIPIVSINNSDSKFTADVSICGNNKQFKLIFKVVKLLVKFSKVKNKIINVPLTETVTEKKDWFKLIAHEN